MFFYTTKTVLCSIFILQCVASEGVQRWRGVAGPRRVHMAAWALTEPHRRAATMATKLEDTLNKLLVADNAVIQEVSTFVDLQEECVVIDVVLKAAIMKCLGHMWCE